MANERTGKPGWDSAPKVRSDAKLKGLPEVDQETLWLLMHPTDGTDGRNVEEMLVHIQEEHGFTVSVSTFYEWLSYYRQQQRMVKAAERALQAKLQLAADPSITPEDLERVAQTIFTAEMLEAGDVKGYVALAKVGLARKSLEHDARRIALLESKAKRLDELEAKAREIKSGGGLSPETLEVIEKQLKLL
ncbi:hypothetical protein OVA24_06300 [Luteolibacter sp. SL250]|uniref:hypothetical protein n=1 Tax=Luteolibacter sp. SL250 TaxID=2995170 RepID=UPI00227228B1|nr:hypothetical protein [Luteolibacter sp. SL250]WAC20992.1 hypothetical protein OVA24_06300 [Luteolibacter sp. SL250]